MINKLYLLIKTSRPMSWILAPLVFFIGIKSAGADITNIVLLQAILLSFPYCILLYGINDVHDYASDRINPRKKLLEGIKLKPKDHALVKKAIIFVILLLLASSVLTKNFVNLSVMITIILASYYYSAPPIRFKERPPLDAITNGFIFLAWFALGYSYNASLWQIHAKIYFMIFSVMGYFAFSTIMDYAPDKKTGVRTFSIVFGKRPALVFAIATFLIAFTFAKIITPAINYFMLLCIGLFSIVFIRPEEKVAQMAFRLSFIAALIAMVFYVI